MKSKCSFILKTSVALLLAILMVLGSVSTVIAAVVDVSTGDQSISTAAKKGLDIAGTAANADLVGTGAISKITAQVANLSSHSSTSFPLEFTESLTKESWYGIRINFVENGDHYCKASDSQNISIGTAKELGWGNGSSSGDSGMSWFQATKTGDFSFSIYTSGGKNYVKIEEAVTKYTITNSSMSHGTVTSSASSAEAGTAITLTAEPEFGYELDTISASGVTLSGSGNTRTFTMPAANVTVSATFKAITTTKTFYVVNEASWTDIYYHVYSGDNPQASWPGTKISSTELGTIDGKNVYSVTVPSYYTHIILNNGSGTQYDGNSAVALTAGKLYPTQSGTPTNLKDYSSSMLDKPKYDVTFTNKPTGGTVTIDGSSSSPAKVAENEDFTILAKPNTGYTVDTVKVGSTTLTAQSGSDSAGYTYKSNVGTAAKTVTVSFKMINYAVSVDAKYSNNGTDFNQTFPSDSKPDVTIAADTATQIDGVKVTAPATNPDGYVFAGWYTAKGSFENAENKDTTFKPNDANAVAIAKYKKLFTVTSFVDSTGTGAGTVTVSKTSVEAGGSYTITATAKSGSAVESVKVNDTAKTASASQTISSVSADQTVVVKFAAKPHVIGKLAAAGWNEPGDAMTSNAAGTEFTYTRTELAAGTYDFQHYIGTGTRGTYDNASTDIATKTISGGATLSSVNNGYGGKKFQLVLTAKSDVTLVSNGSIFTAITVRKSGGAKYDVTFYAKDGAIRGETFGATYANIADTKIYAANGASTVGTKHSGSITNQTYETYKAAKGDTLVIKTQIGATDSGTLSNAADLKAKYYVRGFCINGEVTELLEWNEDGLYTLSYKIPEDTEITKFEITPIYYLKDTTANPIVTYRVTGFTDELKAVGAGKPGWGDTLYTYPYYGKLGGDSNAFGAYPGQPMVYYKGQYQMQIPQKSTTWVNNKSSNTTVSGVTMSNGYWDSVHKSIMGYGDNSTSADHVQTYDYGDFYKIFNEKKPVDNIVFDFKYRTKKHNLVNDNTSTSIAASTLTSAYGTNGNGFEMLTNFHGKNVDLFGNPLSGDAADPSKTTPIYVVSIGGVNDNISGVENIAGYYATEWRVYAPNTPTSLTSTYKKVTVGNKSSIPPEVLVLNNDDTTSFSDTTYPSADTNHKVTDWKAMYTELKQYAGHPVMISYEAADAQQAQGMYYTGTGGATRNDGRWLYSKTGENITSNIRIDVSHDSGATYVENPASGETGHIDGLSAYFTNADAYQKMTYSTTIDPDKTFDFEAKTTNASYKFVGWYMEDGTKITSDNASQTERSGSYTFVARFMEVSSGQLTLSHSVDTGAQVEVAGHYYTCDGSGTTKIGAVVTDAETNEVLRTFDLSSSDITIPEKYIGNDKNYNITVTLEATADTNTAYGTSKLANTDESSVTEARFFNPKTPTPSGKTTTYTFTFNVKNDLYNGTTQRALALTYHSYFIQYKFNYQINYTFDDRNGKTKQYKRIGTLTPGEANTYVKKVDSNRYLDKSFIEKMAPYESNFGQDITWDFEDYLISNGGVDGSNYEYSINAHYTATQSDLNKRNITFALPYQHNNGVAVMTDGVGTKDTTQNLELIAVTDEDGKITQDNRVDFNMIPVLPNNGENGIFTEEGKKNWIAAPATIKDGNSVLNFQYWSVKPTDRAGENDPDVARCYFQGFNFVAYDNYIITPVYGASTVEPSDFGKNTNITYVETTRNQWNSNGTDYPKAQTSYAADLLYNDFIIAYNYDGKDIYNGEANGDIAELGVVVERIKKLEIKDDGSYDTTLSRYTDIAPNEEGVNAAIASDKDINLSGKNSISKHAIDPTSLDNKNRIQFYNGIYNSAGWVRNSEGGQPEQNYAYKNYVYRAYSYMKLKDGTVIKSAVPAYFTMYDVATADLNNSN